MIKINPIYKDHKLCYVSDNVAYFTSLKLKDQWGDDWNDSPYEHNAETPYEETEGQIVKVMYSSYNLHTPDYFYENTPYSVEEINKGFVPWLSLFDKTPIARAGDSLEEFVNNVSKEADLYYPLNILI